jgi:hypothetical protein
MRDSIEEQFTGEKVEEFEAGPDFRALMGTGRSSACQIEKGQSFHFNSQNQGRIFLMAHADFMGSWGAL